MEERVNSNEIEELREKMPKKKCRVGKRVNLNNTYKVHDSA